MVERGDRTLTLTGAAAVFHAPELAPGARHLRLGAAAAHHARVRRLSIGDQVLLSNGAGLLADAAIVRISRDDLETEVRQIEQVARGAAVRLYVPVGDRDRMLWLAEKVTELTVSVWQPVVFDRSRSVSPRGEGVSFERKVVARMIAALEQSGGAWLPDVREEITLEDAAARESDASRYLLDASGDPILTRVRAAPTIAVIFGPEGGVAATERERLIAAGWLPVSLGATRLRFETAGIAAASILSAIQERNL